MWLVECQGVCGDCWAYAVVGSIEAAYGILLNAAQPQLSAERLRRDMRAGCGGGSSFLAFAYLVAAGKASKGLLPGSNKTAKPAAASSAAAAGGMKVAGGGVGGGWGKNGGGGGQAGQAGQQSAGSGLVQLLKRLFGGKKRKKRPLARRGMRIAGFERASFYGWFWLLLAVRRQPVVVHIEASAPSFMEYDGFYKYADPLCFTYSLNHVVLLVGYRLVGADDAFPHMVPPFWIIRNSWGAAWGDGGHMRMDIQGGDVVCGINTLPGLYPIVRSSKDPCSGGAMGDGSGSLFNACGGFPCRRDGSTC
ncbi:hypothetical protein CLOM_g22918 [Closterium sp. NIES-68]|nr:hypothetical protein CLOM_g22918 [Closterium sp. NIES-68]GJP75331.1 hypothetical protein CLOP_g5783 [Closterium sp. NIES-67]